MKKLTLILAILTTTCGPQFPVTDSTAPKEDPVEEETFVTVCVDDNNETLTCEFEGDCCDGFTCTRSTESHYKKICVKE